MRKERNREGERDNKDRETKKAGNTEVKLNQVQNFGLMPNIKIFMHFRNFVYFYFCLFLLTLHMHHKKKEFFRKNHRYLRGADCSMQ
jgi:hypothetical protein